jgi:hypothetical protein
MRKMLLENTLTPKKMITPSPGGLTPSVWHGGCYTNRVTSTNNSREEQMINTITVTYPVQRDDIDEQAMVIIEAEVNDHDYWLERIENESGVDITNRFTDEQIDKFLNDALEIVNQDRHEYIIGSIESRLDTINGI